MVTASPIPGMACRRAGETPQLWAMSSVDSPDQSSLEVGQRRRFGPYWIIEHIGTGGFGDVYRAEHADLKRVTALKVLKPVVALTPSVLMRFRREAEAACHIVHPGLARVYDFGQEGSRWFLAMEFIEGETLAAILSDRGALAPAQVHDLACELMSTLVTIHAGGLVHRDLKPANVMVDAARQLRVLDLGLVKWTDRTALTEDTIVGTPRYISPEMLIRDDVDARSDLYQAGLIVYELLTGEPLVPSTITRLPAILSFVAQGDRPPMPVIEGPYGPGLLEFLKHSIPVSRDERFATASDALASLQRGAGLVKFAPHLVPPVRRSVQQPPAAHGKLSRRRSPRHWWSLSASLAILVGISVLATSRRPSHPRVDLREGRQGPSSGDRSRASPSPSVVTVEQARSVLIDLYNLDIQFSARRLLSRLLDDHDRVAPSIPRLQADETRRHWRTQWNREAATAGVFPLFARLKPMRSWLDRHDRLSVAERCGLVNSLNEIYDIFEVLSRGYGIDPGVSLDELAPPGDGPLTQAPPGARLVATWVIGDGGASQGRTVPSGPGVTTVAGPSRFTRNELDFDMDLKASQQRRKRVRFPMGFIGDAVTEHRKGGSVFLSFRTLHGDLGERMMVYIRPALAPTARGQACALRPRGGGGGAAVVWHRFDGRLLEVEAPELDLQFQGRSFRLTSDGIVVDTVSLWVQGPSGP